MIRTPDEAAPGYTIGTWPRDMQKQFMEEYNEKYPEMVRARRGRSVENSSFKAPEGYSAHVAHHKAFMNAVRTRKPVIEDATFGYRAAGPALLSNESYYQNQILYWDPKGMRQVSS
jgi:hypothetical protein